MRQWEKERQRGGKMKGERGREIEEVKEKDGGRDLSGSSELSEEISGVGRTCLLRRSLHLYTD